MNGNSRNSNTYIPTHETTVKFTVSKSHSYETDIFHDGSSLNLISSEHPGETDDVFESSTLQLQGSRSTTNGYHAARAPSNRPRRINQLKMKLMLFCLAITIIIVLILVFHFYRLNTVLTVSDGVKVVAKVDTNSKIMHVLNKSDKTLLTVALDSKSKVSGTLRDLQKCSSSDTSLCISWLTTNSSLTISAAQFGGNDDKTKMHCVKVEWSIRGSEVPMDCVDISLANVWFGAHDYILWQKNNLQLTGSSSDKCIPYIPGGYTVVNPFKRVLLHQGGSVIEPTWFSSTGAVLKASTHHNLNVCSHFNATSARLCLSPLFEETHQEQYHTGESSHLDYMVCVGDTLPAAFRETTEHFLKPNKGCNNVPETFTDMVNDGVFFESELDKGILDSRQTTLEGKDQASLVNNCSSLIEKPLWNFEFRSNIVDVDAIRQHLNYLQPIGGTCLMSNFSLLYSKIGDFSLHQENYSSRDFIRAIHNLTLKVMFPVTPFVNYDASNFGFTAENQFLVFDEERNAPTLTAVTLGEELFPGILDLTNSNASNWYVQSITRFMEDNAIDFVHMYYGQAAWLPQSRYSLARPLHNIGHFSTLFTDIAARVSPCSVTDVAYDSQSRYQFVLLSPQKSMQETLSAALAAGLGGYPFFVVNFPSTLLEASKHMSRGAIEEGLIRWIEMVSFFPVMHVPWDYQTILQIGDIAYLTNLTERYVALRNNNIVGPLIREAMLEAERNSTRPVVAPMWMAPGALQVEAEERELVLLIQDQFMIGKNLLVAPILEEGQTSRTIYFPPGEWRDILKNRDVNAGSGKWMKNYSAMLLDIPVFVRISGVLE